MTPFRPAGRPLALALVAVAVATAAASADDAPRGGAFSGARAMAHLEEIVAIGPRVSGSPGMLKQRELVVAHFTKAGGTVTRQAFRIRDRRTGKPVDMENLVVEWHPERTDRIVLGAHYDTRPFPDRDPDNPRGEFVGANDGASGVALLMELAAAMAALEGPVGVDFVLFDAEEYVFGPRDPYFLGSTHFARKYAAGRKSGEVAHAYRAGLVLDMVADADLQIWQEVNSLGWPDTRPVVEEVWDVARRLGVRQFVPRPRHTVEDDHLPLRNIGKIPTADVIDFDYPAWHTTRDTADACSGESLEAVGSVVLQWLREQK
ncbi:MAG: M28 family peptidase [Planctomycetaceae bacterium]